MARTRSTTTTRGAHGRERALAADPLPLELAAALDALARHRAAADPLDRAVADVARQRHLGPRERRAVGDLAFGWARRQGSIERLVDAALANRGGIKPSRRDRDLCGLLLACIASGHEPHPRALERLDGALVDVVRDALARGLPPEPGDALPPWLREAVARSHPDPALLAALARPAPFVVAVDPRLATVEGVTEAIAARGLRATPSPLVGGAVRVEGHLPLAALPPDLRDAVWPMDDGSQAVAHAVGARPGELVLDLCAGGGGKTRLLTTTGARIVSADVSAERLLEARSRWRVASDGRAPPFKDGTFDRVLVDAPCSGTGTLRRAPDLARRLAADDIPTFQGLQRQLLAAALALVRPGGLVVYATCSLLREENDDVVDAVLAAHPRARPAPLAWSSQVHLDGSGGRVHLTPAQHGTDGFFMAALEVTG